MEGNAAGFPDLILLRRGEFKVREIKSGRARTTEEQDAWLEAFRAAGIDAGVWRLEDLRTTILEELR